jgi:Na+-transporting methylmalonyl-CoA/oxaloacetate decarboxylase gamma subunit
MLGAVRGIVMMLTHMLQAIVVALLGMHMVMRLLLLMMMIVRLGEHIQRRRH